MEMVFLFFITYENPNMHIEVCEKSKLKDYRWNLEIFALMGLLKKTNFYYLLALMLWF